MEYKGKLYGHLGGKMYFDTGKTNDDWDALEKRVAELEAENASLRQPLTNVYVAAFDRMGEGDEIIGVHRTLEGALSSIQKHKDFERELYNRAHHELLESGTDPRVIREFDELFHDRMWIHYELTLQE